VRLKRYLQSGISKGKKRGSEKIPKRKSSFYPKYSPFFKKILDSSYLSIQMQEIEFFNQIVDGHSVYNSAG